MKLLKSDNQNYDIWLHWDVTKRCNLDCIYCFGKITDTKVLVHPIQTDKLISTLEKTGKTFRISFTGGEPTMIPNFIEACKVITEKHYVSFNSNLITKNFKQFSEIINPKRVLHIHASFHYEELVKNNLLNKFASNYKLLQKSGFNIYAEAVAYPQLVSNIDEIKVFTESNSINLTFAPYLGMFNDNSYPESYTSEEISLFNFNDSDISCFTQKGELCIAGFKACVVFSNGNVFPCHQIKTKIGNIYESINFSDKPTKCPSKKCGCPLNKYDEYLSW